MKKAYLLVYDDTLGTREKVKGYLNEMSDVTNWRYDMPHSFYIISEATAETLATKLRSLSGEKGKFVFVEFSGNDQGWITSQSWYLVNNKRRKPQQEE